MTWVYGFMVWKSVYFPHLSVMFFTCGPNPLLRDSTYSQALPFFRTSITFQGRSLVQAVRSRRSSMRRMINEPKTKSTCRKTPSHRHGQ